MIMPLETANDDADAPRSQTTMAHTRLKGELLNGNRLPGDKLKINEIALEFGVSPGAIREALSRLVPKAWSSFVIRRALWSRRYQSSILRT